MMDSVRLLVAPALLDNPILVRITLFDRISTVDER